MAAKFGPALGVHAPVILGHQKWSAAQEAHHHAAHHDVVEVGHHEVGVVQVDIVPSVLRKRPVRPPMVKRPMKPMA
jgi:hypothetical protein